MLNIKLVTLTGSQVELTPLADADRNELYTAAQDETIWTHSRAKAFGEQFHSWFDKALQCVETKQHLPFVIRRLSDHKVLGSTRYYDIQAEHHRLTIGYTWYIPEVWGSYVNPECKYLLLKHAFEALRVNRIDFCLDPRNTRSCAAIKKLGALEEGVLRQHIILADGFVCDSVIYSMIKDEWPLSKANLQRRFAIV